MAGDALASGPAERLLDLLANVRSSVLAESDLRWPLLAAAAAVGAMRAMRRNYASIVGPLLAAVATLSGNFEGPFPILFSLRCQAAHYFAALGAIAHARDLATSVAQVCLRWCCSCQSRVAPDI